jgi:hypothetical protein
VPSVCNRYKSMVRYSTTGFGFVQEMFCIVQLVQVKCVWLFRRWKSFPESAVSTAEIESLRWPDQSSSSVLGKAYLKFIEKFLEVVQWGKQESKRDNLDLCLKSLCNQLLHESLRECLFSL